MSKTIMIEITEEFFHSNVLLLSTPVSNDSSDDHWEKTYYEVQGVTLLKCRGIQVHATHFYIIEEL